MKTQSSPQRKWLVGLLIVPLLAGLVYGFSDRETIEIEKEPILNSEILNTNTDSLQELTPIDQQNIPTPQEIAEFNAWAKKINAKSTMFSNGATLLPPVNEQNLIKYAGIHNRMSVEQKQSAEKMPFPGYEYVTGTEKRISIDPLTAKTVSILINGKDCAPCELTKKELLDMKLTTNTGQEIKSFAIKFPGFPTQGNKGNMLNKKTKAIVSKYDKKSPAQILNILVEGQKENFNKLILVKEENQNPPTKKEVADYNTWAKAINEKMAKAEKNKSNEYPIVKQKDVVKYKSIYDRMTETQRKTAHSWPNFPPPPPPPPAPKEPKGAKVIKQNLPPPPPPPLPEEAYGNLKDVHINSFNYWAKYLKGKNPNPRYTTDEMYEYYYKMYNAMTDEQKKKTDGLPPPPPPKSKKPKQVAETEIETIIEQEPKKVSKEVIERYAKAHPEAVTKAKINGQIEEIVEIPEDQEGMTTFYGVNYKYVIKDGVTTYYAPKGKTYTEEAFKALIKAIESKQTKVKTSGKNEKGGPNTEIDSFNSDRH